MTDPQHQAPDATAPAKKTHWPAWLAVISTTSLTAGAALLGYGVALAAETMFSLPAGSAFDSAFDLLTLATIAVHQIFERMGPSLVEPRLLLRLYAEQWHLMAIMAVAWIAGTLFFRKASSKPSTKSRRVGWRKPPSEATGLGWHGHAVMLLATVSAPLVVILAAIVVVLGLVTVAMLPMIGHAAGKSFFHEWVVAPEKCQPLRTRQQRLAPRRQPAATAMAAPTVRCVRVVKEQHEIARGRVILSTTQALMLFDPATGNARRVTLGDATIEALSDLGSTAAAPPAQ
ncbi:hypothetical protein V4F39_06450 [Aquincola sp. MAHUQ-54]|uniref:Uncharacterized protein n=1 Tax=Aquincola agrisoli TaxID=3119538 RepID=A0AAW9QBH5_9BURK